MFKLFIYLFIFSANIPTKKKENKANSIQMAIRKKKKPKQCVSISGIPNKKKNNIPLNSVHQSATKI